MTTGKGLWLQLLALLAGCSKASWQEGWPTGRSLWWRRHWRLAAAAVAAAVADADAAVAAAAAAVVCRHQLLLRSAGSRRRCCCSWQRWWRAAAGGQGEAGSPQSGWAGTQACEAAPGLRPRLRFAAGPRGDSRSRNPRGQALPTGSDRCRQLQRLRLDRAQVHSTEGLLYRHHPRRPVRTQSPSSKQQKPSLTKAGEAQSSLGGV
mmetsp:Transcript_3256/g.7230  ORF Transcript_3256/g.7230 Transcript_3256/m.7230 type:complete len:206 (+) Transcript_3256:601-1218(+)